MAHGPKIVSIAHGYDFAIGEARLTIRERSVTSHADDE